MRQQKITLEQLAEEVADFLEPVIPYLVIGSKRADAEAGKKAGPIVWEIKKKLWGKLCSKERPELKEAAGDMVIAPSNPEVKQVLTRKILKSLEQDSDLALEISSLMEDEDVQKMIKEESVKLERQRSNDKSKVFKEFNKLLVEFLAKESVIEALEQSDADPLQGITSGASLNVKKLSNHYTHIQLNQEIQTEGTPSAIRMAKIAEMNVRGLSEDQIFQARFSIISQLEGPEKDEFMEKALDFASRIEYGDLRSRALSLIVPNLREPRRAELIEKALCSASNIQDEDERSLVINSLAPHLRGPGKERLIEDIFALAFHMQYSDAKFQILSSIVPHLYGSKNERIMEKALELVYSISSEYLRVQSLSLLAPFLDWQKSEEVIDEALELAFNLKDKDVRPEALSFIIPYLEGIRRKEVIEKALMMAASIKSDYRKAQAFSSLDPYLE